MQVYECKFLNNLCFVKPEEQSIDPGLLLQGFIDQCQSLEIRCDREENCCILLCDSCHWHHLEFQRWWETPSELS